MSQALFNAITDRVNLLHSVQDRLFRQVPVNVKVPFKSLYLYWLNSKQGDWYGLNGLEKFESCR